MNQGLLAIVATAFGENQLLYLYNKFGSSYTTPHSLRSQFEGRPVYQQFGKGSLLVL